MKERLVVFFTKRIFFSSLNITKKKQGDPAFKAPKKREGFFFSLLNPSQLTRKNGSITAKKSTVQKWVGSLFVGCNKGAAPKNIEKFQPQNSLKKESWWVFLGSLKSILQQEVIQKSWPPGYGDMECMIDGITRRIKDHSGPHIFFSEDPTPCFAPRSFKIKSEANRGDCDPWQGDGLREHHFKGDSWILPRGSWGFCKRSITQNVTFSGIYWYTLGLLLSKIGL